MINYFISNHNKLKDVSIIKIQDIIINFRANIQSDHEVHSIRIENKIINYLNILSFNTNNTVTYKWHICIKILFIFRKMNKNGLL